MPKTIKIFTASHCGPCHEITELLKHGKYKIDINDADIELVDIETDEGFAQIAENNLDRVPVARFQGKNCIINIDRGLDIAFISCAEAGNLGQLDSHKGIPSPAT